MKCFHGRTSGPIQQTNKQILTGSHALNSTVFFHNLQFTNICHLMSHNTLQQYYFYCTVSTILYCNALHCMPMYCIGHSAVYTVHCTVLHYTCRWTRCSSFLSSLTRCLFQMTAVIILQPNLDTTVDIL